MNTGGRKSAGRRTGRRPLIRHSDAYREVIEYVPDISEEVPELDIANSTDEQVRLLQRSKEDIIRHGRA